MAPPLSQRPCHGKSVTPSIRCTDYAALHIGLAQYKHSYYNVLMESNIAFLCSDIGRLFRKRFSEIAGESGPTGVQWRTLLVLERCPGISQGTLAEQLDIEPITVCRMVDRLEQAKLVERRRDPKDRRIWQLFLTDAAGPVVAKLHSTGTQLLGWATSDLTEDERATLTICLTKIRDKIGMTDTMGFAKEVHHG